MREIKFRGYNKEIKKWIYGCLLKCWSKVKEDFIDDELMIVSQNSNNYYEIDKDSVGQYTGFKDKNGVEIYEGDVLEIVRNGETYHFEVYYCKEMGIWGGYDEFAGDDQELYKIVKDGDSKIINNIY